MTWLVELYATQPFWVWLAIGVLLLAVEAMFSTEWLLWPAVAAGIVAVMTAAGFQPGAAWEVAIFAALTVVATLLSRRLAGRVNPIGPDVNDREIRLIGQRARVVEPFVNGRGRVFVTGAEWSAELVGAPPAAGQDVLVERVSGSCLTVRAD